MNSLAEIIKIMEKRGKNTTSQNMKSEYKCDKCKDTTWIPGQYGMIRCDCWKKELSKRRWNKFGVNPEDVKLIKDYEVKSQAHKIAKDKAVTYVKSFEEIKKQRNNSIAFLGQPGAGKTHLALGIGKALLEKGIEVTYMPYLEVMRELKSNANAEEYYIHLQSKYLQCEVLIIDDLFKDKVKNGRLCSSLNEADMKHIYPILNQRYNNHKPTVYSSECNADMLIDLDGALAGRIIESCKENMIIFKYAKENNYRLMGI